MLTVKHIEDDGRENLKEAVSVEFFPERNELVGHGSLPGATLRWGSGTAYVMNEQGKTVGAYNLRPKPKK